MSKYQRSLRLCFYIISGFTPLFLGIFGGCKSNPAGGDSAPVVYPDSGLSYFQHIRPIFLQSCANEAGCHQSTAPAANLDLETDPPTFLSSSGLVVIPFSRNQSLLYQTLFEATAQSRRMPPFTPLLEAEIEAIGQWIDEGAVTNN